MPKNLQKIKCVVWDLDNTLWHGVLLENSSVSLNNGAFAIVKALDRRGILQSISSKNNHDDAMLQLKTFGLDEYFLYPMINWGKKSSNIANISKKLNLGIDTFAFIDDQAFELDEVNFVLPEILCVNASDMHVMLEESRFMPRFITEDSKMRRQMYKSDIKRNVLQEKFSGSTDEFLRTLNMRLTITEATENDLKRAEELTLRTHQLNTTGYTYSYDELNCFRISDSYSLLIADLEDKYGTYGKIGLVLLEKLSDEWRIKLLLMSCRVMSRGIGSVLVAMLRHRAKEAAVRLTAEFVENDRNRMMYMTYKFAGFYEKEKSKKQVLLENNLHDLPKIPDFLRIISKF